MSDTLSLQVTPHGNAVYDDIVVLTGGTVSNGGTIIGTYPITVADGASQTISAEGAFAGQTVLIGLGLPGNPLYDGGSLDLTSVSLDGVPVPGAETAFAQNGLFSFNASDVLPPPITIGSGPDILTLQVSEDPYMGNAQFTIDVNNQQVGGVLTTTALHGQTTQTINVEGNFGFLGFNNTVTVNFLNDAYGGTPQTDRNLYVESATYSYPATALDAEHAITDQPIPGAALALYSQGSQSFSFSTPGYQPFPITPLGDLSASTGILLSVSQDAYGGNAQFTLSLDGQQVGGVQTVNALSTHDTGEAQTFAILGSLAPGLHTVSVDFLNDAFAGMGMDRNLYVEGASYGFPGVARGATPIANSTLDLLSAGTQSFSFDLPPPPITVGSGPDTLSLQVSEDAYQGDAQFTIDVNNEQVGGVLTATALHAYGTTQTINVEGNFGVNNTVTINYLNDDYAGTPTTDRNLYVDSATYSSPASANVSDVAITNQTIAGAGLSLTSQGSQSFSFATPGYDPVAPTDVSDSTTSLGQSVFLYVSEDAFMGDAQFTIAVDGQQTGGVQTVNPLSTHNTGEAQLFTVGGNFAAGQHTVSVDFLNDAFAGQGQDRNLYVENAAYVTNGARGGFDFTPIANSALTLLSAGTQSFTFTVPAH